MTTTPYHLRKIPTVTRPCIACNVVFTGHYSRRICDSCRPRAYSACHIANAKVQQAMKSGKLPSVRGMKCTYCRERAVLWEHRDYNKPLDVVPSCTRCNHRIGPGARGADIGPEPCPSILRVLAKRRPLPR